jgi:hypothetical protein
MQSHASSTHLGCIPEPTIFKAMNVFAPCMKGALPAPVVSAYIVSGLLAYTIYHGVAARSYSSILTMSAIVQCLGIVFLCMQVLSSKSAFGISASSLKLDALALALRLSSTSWLNGYLPVDKSGDYVIQAVDFTSMALLLFLMHQVLVVRRSTYQESDDSMSASPMVLVSLGLAALLHGSMDAYPLFDTFWMAGLFLSVVAVLPQLGLITQSGGRAAALTSHHIAALAVSRVLSGLFMWEARNDIKCKQLVQGFEHAIFAILLAHAVHLLLLADFGYYYMKALVNRGPSEPLQLGEHVCV